MISTVVNEFIADFNMSNKFTKRKQYNSNHNTCNYIIKKMAVRLGFVLVIHYKALGCIRTHLVGINFKFQIMDSTAVGLGLIGKNLIGLGLPRWVLDYGILIS